MDEWHSEWMSVLTWAWSAESHKTTNPWDNLPKLLPISTRPKRNDKDFLGSPNMSICEQLFSVCKVWQRWLPPLRCLQPKTAGLQKPPPEVWVVVVTLAELQLHCMCFCVSQAMQAKEIIHITIMPVFVQFLLLPRQGSSTSFPSIEESSSA